VPHPEKQIFSPRSHRTTYLLSTRLFFSSAKKINCWIEAIAVLAQMIPEILQ
jgi:hypothetical protein